MKQKIKRLNKRLKKINKERLIAKAVENGLKKAIEILIIAFVVGASFKIMMVTVPAVMAGSVLAKIIKKGVLKQ